MSTENGTGTRLISVTRRNEKGQNYRVLFSVWMNMPIKPLERHLIGNYTLTSVSSKGREFRTEYSYQDLGTSPLKFHEVLFVYLLYWVVMPVVGLGPAIIVFEALPSSDAGPVIVLTFATLFVTVLAEAFLWAFLYPKWERGSYKGYDLPIKMS